MNLADYLSELLGQYDEVSVPSLGYFVRTRVNAYYNDGEARFYPPYHQVRFVPKPKDDESFAQYVADKKNISLASSKYFIEKFINKLKEDAGRGKYLFADLGSFQTEQDQLVFKPNDRIPADPAFYGYLPVDITRPGQPLSIDQKKPVFVQAPAVSTPARAVTVTQPAQTTPQQQYYEEETEQKRGINVWLVILLVLMIVALALVGVYKLYPSAFDNVRNEYNKITGKKTIVVPVKKQEIKKDTVKKTDAGQDSTTKVVTPAAPKPDTIRYEAIVEHYFSLENANTLVTQLNATGLKAYVVPDAPGTLHKVSVGAFSTYNKADSVIQALIATGKIKKYWHHGPLEIKPPLETKPAQ